MSTPTPKPGYTLDFGKYKGSTLDNVPLHYVIWLAGYSLSFTRKKESTSQSAMWIKNNKPEARMSAENFLRGRCWSCGSNLVSIGSSRFNGAGHDDWQGRIFHKKCWAEIKKEEREQYDAE